MDELRSHQWPGNVRELANVIEHATILCDKPPIRPEHLPKHFTDRRLRKELRSSVPMSLREIELVAVQEAMERHGGNKQASPKSWASVSRRSMPNSTKPLRALDKSQPEQVQRHTDLSTDSLLISSGDTENRTLREVLNSVVFERLNDDGVPAGAVRFETRGQRESNAACDTVDICNVVALV